MKNKVNKLITFRDGDGLLIPIEFGNIRFTPKRIFVISDVPKGAIRGNHAHFKTEQLLVCIKGKILVVLDDGKHKTETLIQEGETIYIDKMTWDYQQFLTGEEFMVVICSTGYNAKDYIEDREEFYKIAQRNGSYR